MAFYTGIVVEVQSTGSDGNNGAFNPDNVNMATDGAATSATGVNPSFTSASYTFISRDTGHFLFIKSGTNWKPGWYKILNVSAGAATIEATIGRALSYDRNQRPVAGIANAAAGCATTASPTGATWTVDYSQNSPINFTDLVAATTTTFTSAANPIGKNMVGNHMGATGTGWTSTAWEVISVTGTTGTAGNFFSGTTIATASSTGGTGPMGGPYATLSKGESTCYAGTTVYIKAATYNEIMTCTSFAGTAKQPRVFIGYTTYRGDNGQATISGAGSRANCITSNKDYQKWRNFILTSATARSYDMTGSVTWNSFDNCDFQGVSFTLRAISTSAVQNGGCLVHNCKFSGYTTSGIDIDCLDRAVGCRFISFPNPIIAGNVNRKIVVSNCEFVACSGSQVLSIVTDGSTVKNCTFDSNTTHCINLSASSSLINTLIRGNLFTNNATAAKACILFFSSQDFNDPLGICDFNAFANNTQNYNLASTVFSTLGPNDLTGSFTAPYNSPGSANYDYRLNNTAGHGAALQNTGPRNTHFGARGAFALVTAGPRTHPGMDGGCNG